jgi:prepilin-type N-terminal cleavage/methylation domain-containing protein
MTRNKKAFTLIEVLVVVLIIGILAAIALPQYQLAVAKARMSEGLLVLKSIKQATDRYQLITDKVAPSFEYLDITLPNCNKTFTTCSSNSVDYTITPSGGVMKASLKGRDIMLERNTGNNILWCQYKTGNSLGEKVCTHLAGGAPATHFNGGYSYHVISNQAGN